MYFKEEDEARAKGLKKALVGEISEFILFYFFCLQLLSEDWHQRDSCFFSFSPRKPSHLSVERPCSRPLHKSTLSTCSFSKTFSL